MIRVYMMSYDPFTTNVPLLHDYVNKNKEVINWRYPAMPGTLFIASRMGIHGLSQIMQRHMYPLHFFLAEISIHSISGWANQDIWNFIQAPPDVPPSPTTALRAFPFAELPKPK